MKPGEEPKKLDVIWEGTLAEIVGAFALHLSTRGRDKQEARREAIGLALCLGNHFGGVVTYIPRADGVRTHVRDQLLMQALDKTDRSAKARREVAEVFGIAANNTYRIERNVRSLRKKNPQWVELVSEVAAVMGATPDNPKALSTNRRLLA